MLRKGWPRLLQHTTLLLIESCVEIVKQIKIKGEIQCKNAPHNIFKCIYYVSVCSMLVIFPICINSIRSNKNKIYLPKCWHNVILHFVIGIFSPQNWWKFEHFLWVIFYYSKSRYSNSTLCWVCPHKIDQILEIFLKFCFLLTEELIKLPSNLIFNVHCCNKKGCWKLILRKLH